MAAVSSAWASTTNGPLIRSPGNVERATVGARSDGSVSSNGTSG
jgi:hypothetical protein